MTVAHRIRRWALHLGVELNRYDPAQSQTARMARLLECHGIDLVLDVGASFGGYGRWLRGAGYRGDIVSFEPLTDAYTELCRVAAADARWHVAPRMAIGARNGEVVINVAGNSVSSSLRPMHDAHARAAPQSRYVGSERVPLRRLDTVARGALEPDRAVLLKIDTQGYEMEVLQGAAGLLGQVRGVQVELSLTPLYDGQTLYREIIDWLAGHRFHLWNVVPGFLDVATGRLLQFDGVFFRQDEQDATAAPLERDRGAVSRAGANLPIGDDGRC